MSNVPTGATTITTFGDCDGRVLIMGDPVYIRQSKLGAYPADVQDGHRNGTIKGLSPSQQNARVNFYGESRVVAFEHLRKGIAAESQMDADGKPLPVGAFVYIRQSALESYSFVSDGHRNGVYRGVSPAGMAIFWMETQEWVVKPSDLRQGVAFKAPAMPNDCDGMMVVADNPYRVRLSSLDSVAGIGLTNTNRSVIARSDAGNGFVYVTFNGSKVKMAASILRRN